MTDRFLNPEPLTAEAFALYGDVIECSDHAEKREINYGNTTRFHNLAGLDITEGGGTPLVSIFRSTPVEQPIEIKIMERHPLSSQAFYPLSDNPYLVIVAEKGEFKVENVRAFIASSTQGVNYHRGTWHHFSLALDDISAFLVIARGGPKRNCDEIELDEPFILKM